MKKALIVFAVLFQVWMVTRAPSGLGMEPLLAAKALLNGQLPYRDFPIHIGPVPVLLFAALFSIKPLVWCSLVFVGFNLLTAWGIYKLVNSWIPASLFLLVVPWFAGNEMFIETMMVTFGCWAIYFSEIEEWWLMMAMLTLAVLTKQSGGIFVIALYRSVLRLDRPSRASRSDSSVA